MLLSFKKRKKKKKLIFCALLQNGRCVLPRARERERGREGEALERYLIKNKIINFFVFKQTKKPMKKGRSTERKEQKRAHTKNQTNLSGLACY